MNILNMLKKLKVLKKLTYSFKSLFNINQCVLCEQHCQLQDSICQYCQNDLPYFTLTQDQFNLLNTPKIQTLLPKFIADHLYALTPYQWPMNIWIGQLKYQGRFEIAQLLSDLLQAYWSNFLNHQNNIHHSHNTLVMSVPLHISKWQQRGFNQAHLLASTFSKKFSYQYYADYLIRQHATTSQVGMSGVERRKNLKNAFIINPKYLNTRAQHVILIDDVVTTGSTTNEICKILKRHGTEKISVLCLCLALPN